MTDDTIVSTNSGAESKERQKWICSICKAIFGLEYEFFDTEDIRTHDAAVHPRVQITVILEGVSA